jgi:hypothetical protein
MNPVDQINQAIRDNPLATGLIGVGLFMTFFGSAGIPKLAAKVPDAAKGAARAASDGMSATARTVSDAASAAGSKLSDAASNLADQASQASSQVSAPSLDTSGLSGRATEMAAEMKDNLAAGAQQVRERITTTAQSGWNASAGLRTQLSENLERQPLLLGALGLAIGAGIASILPATDTERELVGDKATALRDGVKNRATRLMSDVKEEAAAQGITPGAAKGALEEVAQRAKNVASKARHSARGKVTNPLS